MSVLQELGISSVPQELYSVCLVTPSQARQSKGQPVMDQDAESKQQICSSVVISDTQSFPLHWHISLVLTFIPVWEFAPGWEDLAKSLIISVPCSPLCWALLPKVVVCSQGLVSGDVPAAEIFTWFLLMSPAPAFPSWDSL